jgi:hypothetical protein
LGTGKMLFCPKMVEHHILESSGSDNKKLPPLKVGLITGLERSHVQPTEATENIEARIG